MSQSNAAKLDTMLSKAKEICRLPINDMSSTERFKHLLDFAKLLLKLCCHLEIRKDMLFKKTIRLQERNKTFVEQNKTLVEQNKTLAEENSRLAKTAHENNMLVKKITSLRGQNNMLVEQNEMLVKRNKTLVERNKALVDGNNTLARENHRLAKKAHAFSDKVSYLVKELHGLMDMVHAQPGNASPAQPGNASHPSYAEGEILDSNVQISDDGFTNGSAAGSVHKMNEVVDHTRDDGQDESRAVPLASSPNEDCSENKQGDHEATTTLTATVTKAEDATLAGITTPAPNTTQAPNTTNPAPLTSRTARKTNQTRRDISVRLRNLFTPRSGDSRAALTAIGPTVAGGAKVNRPIESIIEPQGLKEANNNEEA